MKIKVTDVHCFAKASIKTPASLFLSMTVPLRISVPRLSDQLTKAKKKHSAPKNIYKVYREKI